METHPWNMHNQDYKLMRLIQDKDRDKERGDGKIWWVVIKW